MMGTELILLRYNMKQRFQAIKERKIKMDIKDYYMREKSEIQKAKDKIMENIMKQQGFYDMYFLGQISVIEGLVNYIDKDYCKIFLKSIIDSSETTNDIKKLASDLIEKYSKEPKFEL